MSPFIFTTLVILLGYVEVLFGSLLPSSTSSYSWIASRAFSKPSFFAGELRMLTTGTTSTSTSTTTTMAGSTGVQTLLHFLNSDKASQLRKKLVLNDKALLDEYEKANFWSGQSFVIKECKCTGIVENGLVFDVECDIRGKSQKRNVVAPFLQPVQDEYTLKRMLVEMVTKTTELSKVTADIASLPFGEDISVPLDLRWNDVPHATWVRAYLYDGVTSAIRRAVNDETIPTAVKSRLQLKVNFPEVNPAFDTYRIGTILEMVRHAVLALTVEEGKRVRVCVQQSLGEGVFQGLPLALASMRVVLEKMDWGINLTAEEKAQPGDVKNRRKEALVRFGSIGQSEVSDDDDVVIVIAPQNVIGGMIIEELESMVKVCEAAGRPVVLVNPSLGDRPSSNNVMQIRGRSERRAIQDSFTTIYECRLLYPSSGGYMFPIRGLVMKKDYRSLWVVYNKEENEKGQEIYVPIGAFPPLPTPSAEDISNLFLASRY